MVERTRVFAIAGLVSSGFAAAFIIASFASPYWVESNKSVSPSGFERMGLWEACFHNYYPVNRPITNKRYEGCWAAISYEMRDLYDHFYPAWMRGVQAMTTLAMLQTVACFILNIIYFIHCFPGRMERFSALISAIIAFIAALFLFISAIMFGVHVDQDRYWLPQPDSIYLSWAYGFCILAAILCLVSAMCMITDFIRLRNDSDPYDRHVDMTSSRQSARYSAPPPKYDVAVKNNKRPEKVPPSHHNAGYSPPSDSWHDGRKSDYRKTTTAVPPDQNEYYSESDYDENHKLNGSSNKVHSQRGRYPESETSNKVHSQRGRYPESETEYDEKPNGRSSKAPRQNGRYSEPQTESDDQSKASETRFKTTRPSHQKSHPQDEAETKSYDRHSDSERPSRRSTRHSESDPYSQHDSQRRSRDRNKEHNGRRHSARRSEPRSQSNDETRSVDRQSGSSRHSRANPRYSEQPSRDEESRSHSKRADTAASSSRRSARHSESQPAREESNLYSRRSSKSRSPSRQNSRRSESQSRHESTRQRY